MNCSHLQMRPEDTVIESLVEYLGLNLYPGLCVTAWPDKRPGAAERSTL